jgi:hypothetical protein
VPFHVSLDSYRPKAWADTPTVAIAIVPMLSAVLDGAVLHSARHSVLQGRGFSACKYSIGRGRLEAELGVVLGHHPLNPIQSSLTPLGVMYLCGFARDRKRRSSTGCLHQSRAKWASGIDCSNAAVGMAIRK